MEMEEIVKLLIVIIVLVITIGAFVVFSDKGGSLIESIKNILRFGW